MGMVSEAPASADSMAYSLSDILAWVCKGGEGGQRLRFCTGYFESKNIDWWTATERRPKLGRLTCQRDQRECFFLLFPPLSLPCPEVRKQAAHQRNSKVPRRTRKASRADSRPASLPRGAEAAVLTPADSVTFLPEDTTRSTALASALVFGRKFSLFPNDHRAAPHKVKPYLPSSFGNLPNCRQSFSTHRGRQSIIIGL